MDEWYEELDFEENPFSTNPSDFVKNLVGRDEMIDELDYRIRSGSLVYVEGPEGSGKSSLLRAIIKRFRGRGRVIYVNSEKFEKKLDVEELLVQRNGLLNGMILKKKPKKMILLLDNVQKLSFRNMERIKNYFDEDYLQAVVFTGEDFDKTGFSESLHQRIEGRVIKIPKMTDDQILEMVRERIGDSKLVSDEVVLNIANRYENIPKKVLKALDEVAEFVVSLDEDVITQRHVDEVLDGEKSSGAEDSSSGVNEVGIEDESEDDEELSADEAVEMLEPYDDDSDVGAEDSETKEEETEKASEQSEEDVNKAEDDEITEDDLDAFFDEVDQGVKEDNSDKKEEGAAGSASSDSSEDETALDDSEDVDELDDFFADDEDSEDSEANVLKEETEKTASDAGDSPGDKTESSKKTEKKTEADDEATDTTEEKPKQKDLDKHVMVEGDSSSEKKKDSDDEFFDDEFFLDDDEDKKDSDSGDDDDIFDEFFDDDEDEDEDK